MASSDLNSNVKISQLYTDTIVDTTTVTTLALDTAQFEQVELYAVASDPQGLQPPYNEVVIVVQESDDASNWTAVDSNFIIGTVNSLPAPLADVSIGYIGKKRYARLEMTGQTASVTDLYVTVTATRGRPHLAPVAIP